MNPAKETPGRYYFTAPWVRRTIIFSGWITMIIAIFLMIFLGYEVSIGFATCFGTFASAWGVFAGIYAYGRSKDDTKALDVLENNKDQLLTSVADVVGNVKEKLGG